MNPEVIACSARSLGPVISRLSSLTLIIKYLVEVVYISDSRITTSDIRESAGMKPWSLKAGINC